jgi:hypothetical protein
MLMMSSRPALGKRERPQEQISDQEDENLKRPCFGADSKANIVWSKLSSITPSQTREIPPSKLRIKGPEFKIGRSERNEL